jgi:hypothetical protein
MKSIEAILIYYFYRCVKALFSLFWLGVLYYHDSPGQQEVLFANHICKKSKASMHILHTSQAFFSHLCLCPFQQVKWEGLQKELVGLVMWLSRFFWPFSVLLKFVANFGLVGNTNMLLSCESLIDKESVKSSQILIPFGPFGKSIWIHGY